MSSQLCTMMAALVAALSISHWWRVGEVNCRADTIYALMPRRIFELEFPIFSRHAWALHSVLKLNQDSKVTKRGPECNGLSIIRNRFFPVPWFLSPCLFLGQMCKKQNKKLRLDKFPMNCILYDFSFVLKKNVARCEMQNSNKMPTS